MLCGIIKKKLQLIPIFGNFVKKFRNGKKYINSIGQAF